MTPPEAQRTGGREGENAGGRAVLIAATAGGIAVALAARMPTTGMNTLPGCDVRGARRGSIRGTTREKPHCGLERHGPLARVDNKPSITLILDLRNQNKEDRETL